MDATPDQYTITIEGPGLLIHRAVDRDVADEITNQVLSVLRNLPTSGPKSEEGPLPSAARTNGLESPFTAFQGRLTQFRKIVLALYYSKNAEAKEAYNPDEIRTMHQAAGWEVNSSLYTELRRGVRCGYLRKTDLGDQLTSKAEDEMAIIFPGLYWPGGRKVHEQEYIGPENETPPARIEDDDAGAEMDSASNAAI